MKPLAHSNTRPMKLSEDSDVLLFQVASHVIHFSTITNKFNAPY